MRGREATAKRYAKAAFLLARESGLGEAVGADLGRFWSTLGAEPKLREFLVRPWVKGAVKKAVTTLVAERLGCGRLARDLLGTLAARRRMDHLPEIARVYRELLDRELGRVRARVRTAVAFTVPEREELAERLGRVVGKTVMVEESVDPALLGGFVAQIGSLVLDGSLDGQLARMRERLVRG